MEPVEGQSFKSSEVKRVIKAVLERYLSKETYNPSTTSKLCKEITQQLRFEIKELGFSRHKIICQLMIAEQKQQGVEVTSRCLWRDDTDSFESQTFANESLVAVATVHGVYVD